MQRQSRLVATTVHKSFAGVVLLMAGSSVNACSSSQAEFTPTGCTKDNECAAGRICEQGACVWIGSGANSSAATAGVGGDATSSGQGGATTVGSGGDGPGVTSSSVTSSSGTGAGGGALNDGSLEAIEACACVACSGHGTCVYASKATSCVCDAGYVADGLSCKVVPQAGGTRYHVDPSGSDANDGLSANSALKTIAAALAKVAPGDEVYLKGGATFIESVAPPAGLQGAAGKPIRISSDPLNRAKIFAQSGKSGVTIYNSSHWRIENLVIVGPGASVVQKNKDGISIGTDLGKYEDVQIHNVETSGFYRGVMLWSYPGDKGYDDVVIEGVVAHDNKDAGISTYAEVAGGHSNVTVRRSTAYGNLGDAVVTRPSGDGIVLGGVKDGLVEHCLAYNNGGSGTNNAGPVGIWTYDSTRVTIQFSESHSNHAQKQDGDGFDLDVGVTDSVLQYNYSHDNDGAGFILCQTGNSAWNNNVVRYNVSVDDARKEKMGAITWCSFGGGAGMKNSFVYGNTVTNAYGPALNPAMEAGSTGHLVFNNIFVTSNGKPLVWVWGAGTSSGLMSFAGNRYFTTGGAPAFEGSSSLEAWRASKAQEKLDGKDVGSYGDPKLLSFKPSCVGKGGKAVSRIAPLRLAADSPAIDAGLDPSKFVNDAGEHDFWGASLPQGATFDIGAEEKL